jgi:hypothetical protein
MNKLDCVYYCLNNKNKNNNNKKGKKIYQKICKLIKLNFFILNEIENINIIKNILNYNKFYYIYESIENTNISLLVDDAEYLNYSKNIYNDNSILVKLNQRNVMYLDSYLGSLSCSKKYIITLIEFYRYLLNSIHLLVSNGIIHNNINFFSIVVDSFELPIVSNFSCSINMNKTDFSEYVKHLGHLKNDNLGLPVEFHILFFIQTNKLESLSKNNIETIINELIEQNYIINSFGKSFAKDFKREGIEYFNKYVNMTYDTIICDILRFYKTWDNYSLSICYLKLLIGVYKKIQIKNKFVVLFMKLLVNNISYNPEKRLLIEETTNKFEDMMNNIELTEFKSLIEKM